MSAVIVEFKSKRDKEHLLEKAKKMEEYASMIVECIEDSKANEEYDERAYRHYDDYDDDGRYEGRYAYKRRMR